LFFYTSYIFASYWIIFKEKLPEYNPVGNVLEDDYTTLPRTSGSDYILRQRHILEERNPQDIAGYVGVGLQINTFIAQLLVLKTVIPVDTNAYIFHYLGVGYDAT
jgi:hypothetical protein